MNYILRVMISAYSDRLRQSLIRITDRLNAFRNILILRNLLFIGLFVLSVFFLSVLTAVFSEVSATYFIRYPGYFAVFSLLAVLLYTVFMMFYYSGRRLFRIVKPYNEVMYSHLLSAYELFLEKNRAYSAELISDYAKKTEESLLIFGKTGLVFSKRVRSILYGFLIFNFILITVSAFNYREIRNMIVFSRPQMTEKAGILIDIGKIRKEYYYPSYTGLERIIKYDDKRVLEGLKGTVVRLRVDNKINADYARIIYGSNRLDMKKDGLYFDGEVGLNESSFLRIDFFKSGLRYSSPEYKIRILSDENPEIYLSGPENILRGSADSKADKRISLSYSASDDFGVSRINIVVALTDGKEKSFRIQEVVPPQKELNGEYLWDYAELSKYVQGELMFALEAEDNDTVSGPKKNRTRFYKIIIPSNSQHFVKDITALKELRTGMLHHLALNLTYTDILKYAQRRPETELKKEVFAKVGEFVERRNKKDTVSMELQRIINEYKYHSSLIRPTLKRITGKENEKPPRQFMQIISDETKMLEKNILVLQDIIDEVVYSMLSALSSAIAELRNELKSLLKKYDETKDDELRVRIMAVLDLLEKSLKEYRDIQSELTKSFSDVNINKEALKNLSQNADDLYKSLGELKENLAQDEMGKFRKRLDELDSMISEIQNDFSGMLSNLSSEKYKELMDSLESMSSDIDKITDEERGISSELAKLEADIRKRYYEALKNLLDKRIKEIIEMIERLDSDITRDAHIIKKKSKDMGEYEAAVEGQSLLRKLPDMLKNYQIFEAFSISRQVVSKMEWIKNIATMFTDDAVYKKKATEFYRSSSDIRDKIKEIVDGSKQTLSAEEKKRLDKTLSRQEKNQKAMEELVSKSQKLFSEFGNSFEKFNNDINAAKNSMGLSSSSMKNGDVPVARSNADDSISKLDDAKREISKMKSRRSKMMAQGEEEEGEGEKKKFRTAEVKMPRKEDFRPKERLREEILKALQEDEVKGYEEFIRRYYEEIIK